MWESELALSVWRVESQEIEADTFRCVYLNWKFCSRDFSSSFGSWRCSWWNSLYSIEWTVTWRFIFNTRDGTSQPKFNFFSLIFFTPNNNFRKEKKTSRVFVCDFLLTKWRNSCGGWLIAHCTYQQANNNGKLCKIRSERQGANYCIGMEWHDICSNLKDACILPFLACAKTRKHRHRRPTTISVSNARRNWTKQREQRTIPFVVSLLFFLSRKTQLRKERKCKVWYCGTHNDDPKNGGRIEWIIINVFWHEWTQHGKLICHQRKKSWANDKCLVYRFSGCHAKVHSNNAK